MSNGNGSASTAIVAIIAIIVVVAAALYFMGILPRGENTTVIEKPAKIIEKPVTK